MQLATVIGHATSTIKHESLEGWTLVLVQPLNNSRAAEGDCQLAASDFHPSVGLTVVLSSDGKGARDLIGHQKSPLRYFIIAIESQAVVV